MAQRTGDALDLPCRSYGALGSFSGQYAINMQLLTELRSDRIDGNGVRA
jgi:hypothetical protein